MRMWARAEREIKCGYCRRRWIARGEPVLKIHLPTMRRDLYRCVDCAGEPVPDHLPPLADAPPTLTQLLELPPREWLPYKETS